MKYLYPKQEDKFDSSRPALKRLLNQISTKLDSTFGGDGCSRTSGPDAALRLYHIVLQTECSRPCKIRMLKS